MVSKVPFEQALRPTALNSPAIVFVLQLDRKVCQDGCVVVDPDVESVRTTRIARQFQAQSLRLSWGGFSMSSEHPRDEAFWQDRSKNEGTKGWRPWWNRTSMRW